MAWICPVCGNSNANTDKYCYVCQSARPRAMPLPLSPPRKPKIVRSNEKCPYCGLSLNMHPPTYAGGEYTYVCDTTYGCKRSYIEKTLRSTERRNFTTATIIIGVGFFVWYVFGSFGGLLGGGLLFIGLLLLGVEFFFRGLGKLSEQPFELNPALTKAVLRAISIIFAALGVVFGFGILWLAFAVVFVGYALYPMPDRFKKPEAFAAVAGAKFILGIALTALLIAMFFELTTTGSLFLFIGIAMISVAFFATPPGKEFVFAIPGFQGQWEPQVNKGLTYLFLFLSIIGLLIVLGMLLQNVIALVFLAALGFISIFMGKDSHARPFAGLIMVAALFIAVLTTYPGVFGSLFFGQWWPTMQYYIDLAIAPFSPALSSFQTGLSDSFLLFTNPAEYYSRQLARQQAAQSRVTEGGTTRSIEFGQIDTLLPSIDPNILMAGFLEITNRGNFTGTDVSLRIGRPTTKDEVTGQEIALTCVNRYEIKSCTAPAEKTADRTCKWESLEPGNSGGVNFEIDFGGCENEGGKFTKIKFDLEYNYTVNVSLGIDVMNTELLQQKILSKEITQRAVESQYSGGPVKAGIWTPKQPLGLTDLIYVVLSATNTGTGKVSGATYVLYVPDFGFLSEDGTDLTAGGCSVGTTLQKVGDFEGSENYLKVECPLSSVKMNDPKLQKIDRKFLYLKYDIENVDQRNFVLIGFVNYTYQAPPSTKELQIVFASSAAET